MCPTKRERCSDQTARAVHPARLDLNFIGPDGSRYSYSEEEVRFTGCVAAGAGEGWFLWSDTHIVRASDEGLVTMLAGSVHVRGDKDGIGTEARFGHIAYLAPNADCSVLYLTELNQGTIKRVDVASGAVSTFAGTEDEFKSPQGIAVSPAGESLYVADDTYSDLYCGGSIRKVDVATAAVTTIIDGDDGERMEDGLMSAFKRPSGVVMSDATTLFVADRETEQIKRVDLSTGVVTILAGSGWCFSNGAATYFRTPPVEHGWNLPVGMCITKDGSSLLVADAGNHMIRSVDVSSGVVTTLVCGHDYGEEEDDGSESDSSQDVGSFAAFEEPESVAVSADNNTLIWTSLHCTKTMQHAVASARKKPPL